MIRLASSGYRSFPRLVHMMAAALVTALMLLALAAAYAHAQSAETKTQAYKQARHCLLASGKVRFVGRRGDGGGYAFFKGYAHIVYWTYHLDTSGVQVGRVRRYTFGLPARKRALLYRCTSVVS